MQKTDAIWDSSALVPLCVGQAASPFARAAMRNRSIAVWWGSPVEMTIAFARLLRAGETSPRGFRVALERLTHLRARWIEVQPSDSLRSLAEELLQRHPLRAADSLQLAAALIWAGRAPRNRSFICLDGRLAEAAGHEGFALQAF